MNLFDVPIGKSVKIAGYLPGNRGVRSKLLALGLTAGTIVTVSGVAPLGDPIHIQVRGYQLALRKSEACWIVI